MNHRLTLHLFSKARDEFRFRFTNKKHILILIVLVAVIRTYKAHIPNENIKNIEA